MPIVLVADDKPTNRLFLTTLLGYGGHRTLEAADGVEALEQVRGKHPDLAIVDVLMPTMDGYEFARQLRNDPNISSTRVIFYTASYHEREVRALAESCGVRHVIIKPAEPEQILAVVAEALDASREQHLAPPSQEFDREHMRLLTDKLSENVNALEAANQRLSDLLEVSRLLASELDGEQMLAKFCPVTREIIGARFAFVGVFSGSNWLLKPLFISGADAQTIANIGPRHADYGILARTREANGPFRVSDVTSDPLAAGLPTAYLGIRSFLGIPLSTPAGLYGLLWVVEKLGGAEFDQDDERVMVSLAAQAGVAYENTRRYRQIQQHAAELERQVEKRTLELRDANKELEAFNYTVAHDLRGPLSQIGGFAELLAEDYSARLSPQAATYLDRIRAGTKQMGSLIEALLSLARCARAELKSEKVDLSKMAREIATRIRLHSPDRKADFRIEEDLQVEGDPTLLRIVMENLLSNAWKYTAKTERAVIEFGSSSELDRSDVFFVRDNGAGFDMRYADNLFTPFRRLHRQEDFAGHGVGLATVQRIIHRHGGRIWAHAESGKGATFSFTIGRRSDY